MKKTWSAMCVAAVLLAAPAFLHADNGAPKPLEERVRHELVRIPYYNVFDNLAFKVDNGVVTLMGQVTDPVVKSDATSVVKHLEGVTEVKNEIEVLPLSPFNNQIRWQTYRAIYAYGPLQRYGLGAVPSIHLIVKNGRVTLEGVVSTEMDRNMAFIRANQVPGVFEVTNDLRVER